MEKSGHHWALHRHPSSLPCRVEAPQSSKAQSLHSCPTLHGLPASHPKPAHLTQGPAWSWPQTLAPLQQVPAECTPEGYMAPSPGPHITAAPGQPQVHRLSQTAGTKSAETADKTPRFFLHQPHSGPRAVHPFWGGESDSSLDCMCMG